MNSIEVIYDCVNNEKKLINLHKDCRTLVVRLKDGENGFLREIESLPLSVGKIYSFNQERNVLVFKFDDNSTCEEVKAYIREREDVRFVGYSFINEENQRPIIYTGNLVIIFKKSIQHEECLAIINDAGLIIKEKLSYVDNGFFVTTKEDLGDELFSFSNHLNNSENVVVCHPELLMARAEHIIHDNQWHLKKTRIKYEVEIDQSANVEAAHAISKGQGVVIAVIDDGVDLKHPEFKGKHVWGQNFSLGNKNNPSPRRGDKHGTACAGIACASGVFGASGVAPNAKLMPIRLVEDIGSYLEAKAFIWAADHGADVISCSWGPKDSSWAESHEGKEERKIVQIPASTRLAIEYARLKGRNGKGCVIVFAAGNGNESVDQDMYASNKNVIAVASCNDRGKRCVYSDFGKAIWCCFPSGDMYDFHLNPYVPLTPGVWTTDISLKNRGFNTGKMHQGDVFGNYVNNFSGTSASCPGVAGVVALMLSVAPALNVDQVREIIKKSCKKIGKIGGGYDKDGHSKFYGYGRIDAKVAVELAKSYVDMHVA